MANQEFGEAVHVIANRLFPNGFDVSPSPPNSFLDLAVHVARTGRMTVADGNHAPNEFDTPETYQAFRAWHDWCHLQGGHDFTLKGECAAVRMQFAMLATLYGPEKTREWAPILRQQIIHDNFGQDVFCPATL
jgi:hypothetical protein